MKKFGFIIAITLVSVMFSACSFGSSDNFSLIPGGLLQSGDSPKDVMDNHSDQHQENDTLPNDGVADENGAIQEPNNSGEIELITLAQGVTEIEIGQSVKIDVTVLPASSSLNGLTWMSDDTSIAIVDSSGYVTGMSGGVTLINCTAPNGKSASCTVKVLETQEDAYDDYDTYDDQDGTENPSTIGDLYSSDFIFYDSSYRKLNDYEVVGLSRDEIQRAINEIYARHGYKFKTKSIRKFFKNMSWYNVNPNFSTKDFNKTERKNLDLLQKYR